MGKVFITGATSGIGKEITKNLEKKYEIINLSRKKSKYTNVYCDLSSPEAYKTLVEKTKELNPKVLVLNAGIGSFGFVKDLKAEDLELVITTNVLTYIKYLTSIWEYLCTNKIKILFTSSTAAHLSGAGQSFYALTKVMLFSFCDSLRTELKFFKSESTITEFAMHFTNFSNLRNSEDQLNDRTEFEQVCKKAVEAMELGVAKFVPKYDEIYKIVFDKFYNDPLEQGISSLEYRMKNGRI